jgi:hypothetical protein
MDFTCSKDVASPASNHVLGEVWEACVDTNFCRYNGNKM